MIIALVWILAGSLSLNIMWMQNARQEDPIEYTKTGLCIGFLGGIILGPFAYLARIIINRVNHD